jgi:hypothetical protein
MKKAEMKQCELRDNGTPYLSIVPLSATQPKTLD